MTLLISDKFRFANEIGAYIGKLHNIFYMYNNQRVNAEIRAGLGSAPFLNP